MKLGHGWTASFLDHSKRVVCTKPGTKNTRRLCYLYEGGYHALKRIDEKSGTTLVDQFNRLPDGCLDLLKEVTRARWG